MKALLYSIKLQFKMDIRNKGIFMVYYIIPILFYIIMAAVFTSINPSSKETLIQSMTIFAVSMGAFLGTPNPLVETFSSDVKKAYNSFNIPLWTIPICQLISGFLHLLITSSIIYFTAPIIFKVSKPEHTLYYFLNLIFFIIVCQLIGTVLGMAIKKSNSTNLIAQMIFLPSLLFSGIMFPISMLPKAFRVIGYIFPATHEMKIMTSSAKDFSIIFPLFLILIAIIILFILVYKKRILKNDN